MFLYPIGNINFNVDPLKTRLSTLLYVIYFGALNFEVEPTNFAVWLLVLIDLILEIRPTALKPATPKFSLK